MLGLRSRQPQTRPGRQEIARSGPERPPKRALAPSCLPQWPRAPAPRAHGVKSLPVSLCSKLFSKRGREWFSCYQHGFWALGNARLFSRPAPQRDLLFPSLPLSLALPRPPTHPDSLLPKPPALRCTPGPPGVTVAWPWRPPSLSALRTSTGPGGCGRHIAGGHVALRRPQRGGQGATGCPQCTFCPQGGGTLRPLPWATSLRRDMPPSRPPSCSICTAVTGWEWRPTFRKWRLRLSGATAHPPLERPGTLGRGPRQIPANLAPLSGITEARACAWVRQRIINSITSCRPCIYSNMKQSKVTAHGVPAWCQQANGKGTILWVQDTEAQTGELTCPRP
nr:uncharacterized protein LOC116277496 isoform X2 [Vicugna pacos]